MTPMLQMSTGTPPPTPPGPLTSEPPRESQTGEPGRIAASHHRAAPRISIASRNAHHTTWPIMSAPTPRHAIRLQHPMPVCPGSPSPRHSQPWVPVSGWARAGANRPGRSPPSPS